MSKSDLLLQIDRVKVCQEGHIRSLDALKCLSVTHDQVFIEDLGPK